MIAQKDLARVRAGEIGARRRWGERRVVNLGELTDSQRRLVLALVEAAKAETKMTAPGGSESPERSAEVRGGSLNDSAA